MAERREDRLRNLLKKNRPLWSFSFIYKDSYEIIVRNEFNKEKRVAFSIMKWNRMTDNELVDTLLNIVHPDLKPNF